MKELKEKQERLHALRVEFKQVYEGENPDVEKLANMNTEMKTLGEDVQRLQELSKAAEENLKAMKDGDTVKATAPFSGQLSDQLADAYARRDLFGGQFTRNTKTFGEMMVESDAYKQWRPGTNYQKEVVEIPTLGFKSQEVKATLTIGTGAAGTANALTNYDRQPGIVLVQQQQLRMRDLLSQGETTAPTIRYMREFAFTNAATAVAEAGLKPQASFDLREVDSPVRKIAVTSKVSDEMFADFPQVRSYVDSRLVFMVAQTEDLALLNGTGVAPNLLGILNVTGIQTLSGATGTTSDNVFKAITLIRSVGFFEPDGIVMHPTDWQKLRLAKDTNNQYYGGGPFTGAYGAGASPGWLAMNMFWGLPVVVTTAIAAGTILVGAFKLGAQIFDRQGVALEMTNANEDDFIHNLVAIRAEERLALVVYRPLAFATVTAIP